MIIAATLAFLPLVLPFPFALLTLKWVVPMIVPEWSHCSAHCPPSTYGERLEWLFILGPSFLTALASILLGIIERIRIHRQAGVFTLSAVIGAAWVMLLGCLYWVIYWIVGLVP